MKNNITEFTKNESFKKVSESLGVKQQQVLNHLSEFPYGVSAKLLAVHMYTRGVNSSDDRNSVHPRLNELVEKGLVDVIGKDTCSYTGRKVAIYKRK